METADEKKTTGLKRKKEESSAVPKKKQTTPTKKPICKYSVKCYQTNKEHREKYAHPWVSRISLLSSSCNCRWKPWRIRALEL